MKAFTLIFILCCSLTSFGENSSYTPIASNVIDCLSDNYDKNGSCELVLSYNSNDLSVTLIKLYNRGSSNGADINDFVKNPAEFKNDVSAINYQEKLNLKVNESVISVGGGFQRNSTNKNQLEIKLRVHVGIKKTISLSGDEKSPEEEFRDLASEESDLIIYEKKRQVSVLLEI